MINGMNEGPVSHHATQFSEIVRPIRVFHVGSGAHIDLDTLNHFGIATHSTETSSTASVPHRQKNIEVVHFDIRNTAETETHYGEFDVAISFGTATELLLHEVDSLIALLCKHSKHVLLSVASYVSDANSTFGIPKEHWISRFAHHGYRLDEECAAHLQAAWEMCNVAKWASQHPLVFRCS
jgi:hypothetical protein